MQRLYFRSLRSFRIFLTRSIVWFIFSIATFLLANYLVKKFSVLDGISLVDLLADEYRIHLLPTPEEDFICMPHSGGFIPRCEGKFNGFNVKIPSSYVSINSLGFRDREYSATKPDDTYRIFALGDSFTYGWGVNNDEPYPKVLEEVLNLLSDEKNFEVLNLGYFASLDDHYHTFLRYIHYSPDLVILESHPNDTLECNGTIERLFQEARMQGKMTEKNRRILTSIEDTFEKEEKCSCLWKYLAKIVALTKELGIPIIVFDLSDGECITPSEDYVYHRFPLTSGRGRNTIISRGDPHPNRLGHRLLAESLLPIVMKEIAASTPSKMSQ